MLATALRPFASFYRAAQALTAIRAIGREVGQGRTLEGSSALARFARALGVTASAAEDVYLGHLGPRAAPAHLASAAATLRAVRSLSWLAPRAAAHARAMSAEVSRARSKAAVRLVNMSSLIAEGSAYHAARAVSLARAGDRTGARAASLDRKSSDAVLLRLGEDLQALAGKEV